MGADLFSIGSSSLRTSKKQLSTTSHNIANANTEGYSRQIATTSTNIPVQEGHNVFGTGVNIQSVRRVHDQLIEKKVNHANTTDKFNEERNFQLTRLEEVFNELNSDGLNKVLNRFFNSFRELSNQPENEVVRSLVRDNAKIVVKDFHRLSESITEIKEDMDRRVSGSVEDINSLATTVAELNKEITRIENTGGESGDLRDQRDNAVRSLSDFFKINTYEDEKGQYVVNIVGAGSLVAGGAVNEIIAKQVGDGEKGSYSDEGRTEISFKAKQGGTPLTNSLATGTLGAALKTRNNELMELRDHMDHLANGLVHSTNAIHRRGFIHGDIPTDQNGNVRQDPNNPNQKQFTGINFFKEPLNLERASEYIELSDAVKSDLNNIATGLEPNSPGDNRIAIAISKLQHEKILGEGSKTLEEGYLESVGKIGLSTRKSSIDKEQSEGILAQAKSIKERLSGVSLDEEAANMVKYQHTYDASAKMIKAADEMFDSVLGMVR